MVSAAMKNLRPATELREQYFQVWPNWTKWAVSHSENRPVLAPLSASDELTPEPRAAAHKAMAAMADMLERIRANGPMSKAPMSFVVALMNSAAEATIDL